MAGSRSAFVFATTIVGLRASPRTSLLQDDHLVATASDCGGRWCKCAATITRLESTRHEGLRPVGIAFEGTHADALGESIEYIGPASELDLLLRETGTTRVIFCAKDSANRIHYSDYCGIPHVALASPLGFHPTERTRLSESKGTIELHCYSAITGPGARLAKRLLDLGLIAICLPLLLPLVLVLSVVIKATSSGPLFFASTRIGQGGRTFRAWKFRSMVTNGQQVLEAHFQKHPEARQEYLLEHKLKNDPRVTTIGKFLRKTSLDELPQLWNVLRGEMSLVGPRPILEDEIKKYTSVYDLYTTVRPGLTGLWQVSGRNNLVYEDRLYFTRFYVQNWSCTLDLYILWRTIRTAMLQEGAY